MIRFFKCTLTQALFQGERVACFVNVESVAQRKLVMLDAAKVLEDLRSPPGNRLEKLTGNRAGQHSMRINSQWRLCFVWTEHGPENVEIVDYH
jgi:proteic killer suppression protein